MTLDGLPPYLKSIYLCSAQDYDLEGLNPAKDFLVEGDIDVPGAVTFQIKVSIKVNWPLPAFIEIPVILNISVSKLRGRVRLCFSNTKNSFLQFVRRPDV